MLEMPLHSDHLSYLAGFVGLIVVLAVCSTFVRLVAPKIPYSALILSLMGLVCSGAVVAEIYGVSPRTIGFMFPIVVVIGIAWAITAATPRPRLGWWWASWKAANCLPELLWTMVLWISGLVVVFLPLWFGYAAQSIVTGHFVCNDSALHALLTRGIEYVKQCHFPAFYHSAVARGSHSFSFYFNELVIGLPASRTIVATSLCFLSLLVFWADSFVRAFGLSSRFRFVIPIVSVSSVLLGTTAYLIFLGQISALPFTLAACTALLFNRRFGGGRPVAFVALFTALGALANYGLFAASILGFAFYLFLVQEVHLEGFCASIRSGYRLCIQVLTSGSSLAVLGIAIVLIEPSVRFALVTLGFSGSQGHGLSPAELANAVGNLPNGYLSSFHLTGLWPSGVEYRGSLYPENSASADILAAILVAEAWLIRRARLPLSALLLLSTFAIPWLSSAVFIKSPYINFKYLTYLVPVFLMCAAVGGVRVLAEICTKLGRGWRYAVSVWAGLLFVAYLGWSMYAPLKVAAMTPTLLPGHLASFEALSEEIANQRALLLTREDWLLFYSQPDDYRPLTLYVPRAYSNQPIDSVVIDEAWRGEASRYLENLPQLRDAVMTSTCTKLISNRFRMYYLDCSLAK